MDTHFYYNHESAQVTEEYFLFQIELSLPLSTTLCGLSTVVSSGLLPTLQVPLHLTNLFNRPQYNHPHARGYKCVCRRIHQEIAITVFDPNTIHPRFSSNP